MPPAIAQTSVPSAPVPAPGRPHPLKERILSGGLPDKPSLPVAFSIPVEPLGFSPPGPLYLGQRISLESLDFLDENHLLFTFRVPGLLHRTADSEGNERQIRAVVLALPTGTVEAEALWTLHDRAPYLWMLNNGHFLLRDREDLSEGDATLVLKPFLRFPGLLIGLELDPTQKLMVTNSREPVTQPQKPGVVGSPSTAAAGITVDGDPQEDAPDLVVRILERESGKVQLVSRVRSTVHLPINTDGYVEILRGSGQQWFLNFDYFTGGSRVLGVADSACMPETDFISQSTLVISACEQDGRSRLTAMNTDGRPLWANSEEATEIWPLLVKASNGSLLARETLVVSHAVNAYQPLSSDDIKGQRVVVLDAATGEVALDTQASPIFDSGGNVAISPSGRLVAVVNSGAIQVFNLPAPPPPATSAAKPAPTPGHLPSH